MNGIQLFVNGSWANSNQAATDYLESSKFFTIIVGTGSPSSIYVLSAKHKFFLLNFEERLMNFSRELSASGISQLASA
jgi:hypothetical protein